MKRCGTCLAALLVLACGAERAAAVKANPIGGVMALVESLQARIEKDGEEETRAFQEYRAWCRDATQNLGFETQTALSQKEKLEATIKQASANIEAATSKVEELAAQIASTKADLEAATGIRTKEHKDFVAAEQELVSSVDTLERALGLLEIQVAKDPSLAQLDASNVQSLVQALGTVIDAAGLPGHDKAKLVSLLQSRSGQQESEDASIDADEAMLGSPSAAVYKDHSGSIVDVLEDLKARSSAELSALRKAETNSAHNYNMLKSSLEDQESADTRSLEEEKAFLAATSEERATAEGHLANTVKDLSMSNEGTSFTQRACMQVAADHEATSKGRQEELNALATAQKLIADTTGAAVEKTYSLIQLRAGRRARMRTQADLANAEAIHQVKRLALKYHSSALEQLASRIEVVQRYGAGAGNDPFVKVRELIQNLIEKLSAEAGAEASEKAYCDEQLAKTEAKRDELDEDVEKLSSKIEKARATLAILKEEVKELQIELAMIAKEQAVMKKIRADQHAAYVQDKADLQKGMDGVRKALDVLRSYYASFLQQPQTQDVSISSFMQQPPVPEKHEKASGAGGGIIDILEVVESDMGKNLAEVEVEEADALAMHNKITQENRIAATLKEQDVKYKTQEFGSLDKATSDNVSDSDSLNEELTAVLAYYDKVKERCIAKPETYEQRKKRRDGEIKGLKAALSTLESDAAFLQHRPNHAGALRR